MMEKCQREWEQLSGIHKTNRAQTRHNTTKEKYITESQVATFSPIHAVIVPKTHEQRIIFIISPLGDSTHQAHLRRQ